MKEPRERGLHSRRLSTAGGLQAGAQQPPRRRCIAALQLHARQQAGSQPAGAAGAQQGRRGAWGVQQHSGHVCRQDLPEQPGAAATAAASWQAAAQRLVQQQGRLRHVAASQHPPGWQHRGIRPGCLQQAAQQGQQACSRVSRGSQLLCRCAGQRAPGRCGVARPARMEGRRWPRSRVCRQPHLQHRLKAYTLRQRDSRPHRSDRLKAAARSAGSAAASSAARRAQASPSSCQASGSSAIQALLVAGSAPRTCSR